MSRSLAIRAENLIQRLRLRCIPNLRARPVRLQPAQSSRGETPACSYADIRHFTCPAALGAYTAFPLPSLDEPMLRITARMLSPSRCASASRFNTMTPSPSPSIVPSAPALNGRARPRRRKRRRLAETHVHEDVVERINAARDRHVRPPRIQLHCRHVQRPQRTRARRIHHAIRPAQVKLIRNPPRRHIAQQPGKRILLPRHIRIRNPLHHILRHCSCPPPPPPSALRQIGCPSRAPSGITNSSAPVTPRITLVLSRLNARPSPESFPVAYPASRSACCATTIPNNCVVSVASILFGVMPNSSGLKSIGSKNAPRFAYVISGAAGSPSKCSAGFQCVAGISVTASTPPLMFAQNASAESAFGKRHPIPTIAKGTG